MEPQSLFWLTFSRPYSKLELPLCPQARIMLILCQANKLLKYFQCTRLLALMCAVSSGFVSSVYGQDLRGFTEYWGSHPGDNVVMYRDGIYMYPCMGRHCEAGQIKWIYGGKALLVRKGVLRTGEGDYYCHPSLIGRKDVYQKCTQYGFRP